MPAASVTQDRTSSGRVETTRTTNPPPQSCPTRSTGAPRRSSCAASQPAYSSIVAPKPAGRAASNPGSDNATVPGRSSAASRPCQTAGVSGTPWTKTAVMPAILPRRRRALTRQLNIAQAVLAQGARAQGIGHIAVQLHWKGSICLINDSSNEGHSVVIGKVHAAPLPGRTEQYRPDRRLEAGVRIGDGQLHPGQATRSQRPLERGPERFWEPTTADRI